nr:putative zinc finger, CCHC-type [Tanacetum cinerariifolium]
MAYRVQNHLLDILIPGQDNAGDALLINVDYNITPICTYIPMHLSQDKLVKLLLEKWITNYEQIHQAPVQSTSAPEFVRHENGMVEINFSSSQPKSNNVFPTGIHMITPIDQEPAQEVKHIWWDVCNCESCLDEAAKINDDEDLPRKRKCLQQKLKRRYEKGDPTVGLLGETSRKFDYYVLYPKAEPSQPPSPHKPPSNITSPTPVKLSPYNQKALSILHQDSPTKDKEVISSPVFPLTKDPSCSYSQENKQEFPALTAFEHLDGRTKHDWKIKNLTTIGLTRHANTISPAEATLNWQSENVVAQNKVHVKILSQQSDLFDLQPLPQSYTHTTSPSLNIWASKQRRLKPPARKEPTFLQESQSIADVVTSTKAPDVLPIQKVNPVLMFLNSLTQTDKPQNPQFISPVTKPQKDYKEFDNAKSFEHLFMAKPENAESRVQFDVEEYEEHQENPNQETPTEFPQNSHIIKRFLTRLQGRLRDCPWEHTTHAREEFLKMKCCSFQMKDLEKHYDRMSQQFYYLNGVDDVNLKQVHLNSFLESLGNETYQALEARNVTIAQTTLGKLYQLILNALTKLCNQKKFLAEFERTGKHLGTTCDEKYLQIKSEDKSSCDCTQTIKKFHSKIFSSLSGKPRFSRRSNKKWKFIRRKTQRRKTSDRCFICQKRGHFARNYPNKKRFQALIQALNQVEPVDVFDLESLYSLDDEPSDSVLCTIAYSDLSFDDDSDTDSLECDFDFGVYMINPIPHVLPIQEDPPLPLAKIHLLTDAYTKPILVIAFFDTSSSVSILNPNILPDHYWKPHYQNFMAANGEKFVIDKISLGIKPEDRPKTAFCIPDHHYQWKSHAELLSKFYSLVTKYEIMLSEKKMEVGVTTIQFLGIKISDEKYQPQPHVAQELPKFPDELSSQKMIQQFLRQTKAVKAIKSLAEKMPPLKIRASSEKGILQTNASDEYE